MCLGLVGGGVAQLAGPAPATAVVPGRNGLIVFHVVSQNGGREIFTVKPDGTGRRQLTDNTVDDGFAAWSPNGKRIAFARWRDGDYEIYTMLADGSEETNLTNGAGYDFQTAWSPSGQRIAFASTRDDADGHADIYTMRADGTDVRQLTKTSEVNDVNPVWSPNGKLIAFTRFSVSYTGLYTMRADGGGQTKLKNASGSDHGDWQKKKKWRRR